MLGFGNYLYRMIPANPILLRVIQTASKRKRDLLMRCAYLGVLVLLVTFLLLGQLGDLDRGSLSQLTKQSVKIFISLSYVQLALVTLLAPIFTAGAITQERDSQTYDILLSTPLSNAQIVFGTLLSRLFFIVTLLLSGIPIFAITQIFGGVAIEKIVISWLISCSTAFITGAIAMAIACLKVGTRRTIFSFYFVILIYMLAPLAVENLGYARYNWSTQPESHISWLAGVNPFLALRSIFGETEFQAPPVNLMTGKSWLLTQYLSKPWFFYPAMMFTLSFLLVTPSILLLRKLAQSTTSMHIWVLQKLHLATGDKTRKPRSVWMNPIAWREARTKGSANRAILIRYGFMILGIGAAIVLIVLNNTYPEPKSVIASRWNSTDNTLSIYSDGKTTLYRVNPTSIRITFMTDNNKDPAANSLLRLDDLRPEMVVMEDSLSIQNQTITGLSVAYPKPKLDLHSTRQFLLYFMLIELAIIMLILTQNAASTVTREKEDGALDILLATPITSRYYIWGKLRGLVSFVIPLLAVPIASILIFVAFDAFKKSPWAYKPVEWTVLPESLLVLPASLVISAAFAAILGMRMSLQCKRTIMAVMLSLGVVGAIFGLFWVCGFSFASSRDLQEPGVCIGCFSPFTLMALSVNPMDIVNQSFGAKDLSSLRILIFLFGWIASAIYAIIVWTMYKSMVYNFDMTIRKQNS